MTDLNETLQLIAAQLKCDPRELIDYAAEDTLGGFHIDIAKREFPMGSLWREEGQILYALVRWLKPTVIAELGGWRGASATHLAQAVKMNGVGHVFSVDNGSEGGIHGELIPTFLQEYTTLVQDDARVWLASQQPQSIGLLFEDASHATSLVTELTRLALVKCESGGLYINHDAAHDFAYDGQMNKQHSVVGQQIREGLVAGGAYFSQYRAEPSDCGLAITVIPGVRKAQEPIATKDNPIVNVKGSKLASDHLAALSQPGNAHIESMSEPPIPMSQRLSTPKDATEEDTKPTPTVKKPRKPRAKKGTS